MHQVATCFLTSCTVKILIVAGQSNQKTELQVVSTAAPDSGVQLEDCYPQSGLGRRRAAVPGSTEGTPLIPPFLLHGVSCVQAYRGKLHEYNNLSPSTDGSSRISPWLPFSALQSIYTIRCSNLSGSEEAFKASFDMAHRCVGTAPKFSSTAASLSGGMNDGTRPCNTWSSPGA